MKKRGGLARAIVTERRCCDEPTSGLDPIEFGPNGSAAVGYAQGIPGNDPDRGQP